MIQVHLTEQSLKSTPHKKYSWGVLACPPPSSTLAFWCANIHILRKMNLYSKALLLTHFGVAMVIHSLVLISKLFLIFFVSELQFTPRHQRDINAAVGHKLGGIFVCFLSRIFYSLPIASAEASFLMLFTHSVQIVYIEMRSTIVVCC